MALPLEAQGVFDHSGIPVLFTGVGKVNAAIALTRTLLEHRASGRLLAGVVNFGTAGSRRFSAGSLVACTEFLQRDMDASGLGFAPGVTPFDDAPASIRFPSPFTGIPAANCGTGDSFDTGKHAGRYDVVDMEAFALARTCLTFGTAFACSKYITDGADSGAAANWQENLHRAADGFLKLYRQLQPTCAQ